ncbi:MULTISPECIES: flagellar basal body L-ring protein FlgH [Propionispira]|uniref:flagellar basal body L-ring protein FlgH n=1 Tax=Propionispira TaxID=84034 RepID=UPI000365E116|nr:MULTISPECIES: flagellar basal body L-ring protein FlgH [Propionispira]
MDKWIKNILVFCVVLGSLTFANIQSAAAESLWVDNGAMNLFADHKARNVGDILTIVISESTKTSTTKSDTNSKSGSQSLSAGVGIFTFLNAASAAGSDSFKANGAASANNSVTGNVSVTVKEVQPNGNMVVEGTQSIWQNKDEHKITLNGIVRRDDVTSNNTVPSNLVANATLKFDGKGPLNAKQRQGILTQVLNILF